MGPGPGTHAHRSESKQLDSFHLSDRRTGRARPHDAPTRPRDVRRHQPDPLRPARNREDLRHVLGSRPDLRSEEHTSEHKSLMRISYAVFCLTNISYINTLYHTC